MVILFISAKAFDTPTVRTLGMEVAFTIYIGNTEPLMNPLPARKVGVGIFCWKTGIS